MALRREHELHQRRRGRNTSVGLLLVAVIAIVFGLTVVKVTSGDFQVQPQGVTDGN
jgi:predicted nucleic acid-binding protein